MSIPKEPRQLMVNLMYIVLTAILALNVSAEILNAFLVMDKSIDESNHIVALSNANMMKTLEKEAEAYPQFVPFRDQAREARVVSKKFKTYITSIRDSLIAKAGGLDEEGKPLKYKDKDISTRWFVTEGKGSELELEVLNARESLLQIIENDSLRTELSKNIPLKIDPIPEDSDKADWADFTFRQMPVAAVLPMLSKFQNDMEVAETAILEFFYKNVHAENLVLDQYEAVIAADKSYVIRGEELSAEIFLGAYSSTTDNLTIQVNGRSYPVRNGKASFSAAVNNIGTHDLDVKIGLRNPKNDKIKYFNKKYRYEVGERSVAVSADKMNVLYAGVGNPLSISAAGVPSEQVQVTADGIVLEKISNGKYLAKPSRSGLTEITVSGGGLPITKFPYRIKAIPNPVIMLGNKMGGNISAGEIKVHAGLRAVLENFDFNARCKVQGFEVARVPKGKNVQTAINQGGSYTAATKRIIDQARRNDTFYFDKIKVRCPGDRNNRTLNSLIFHIK